MTYLFFCAGTRWRCKYLKKDFGHCYVINKNKQGWSIWDPTPQGFKEHVIKTDIFLPKFIKNRTHHIMIECTRTTHKSNWLLSDCVGMCKYFLGIKAWWIITPWQLYKHVRKHAYGRKFWVRQ